MVIKRHAKGKSMHAWKKKEAHDHALCACMRYAHACMPIPYKLEVYTCQIKDLLVVGGPSYAFKNSNKASREVCSAWLRIGHNP